MEVTGLTIIYFAIAVGVGVVLGIAFAALRTAEERAHYKKEAWETRKENAALKREYKKVKNELANERLSHGPEVEVIDLPEADDSYHKPF
ncbi:MAG: hypothetical protein J6U23_07245 [Clostridiales bacterium]|nr:hypothetical protein [Clostridiales bacterium]